MHSDSQKTLQTIIVAVRIVHITTEIVLAMALEIHELIAMVIPGRFIVATTPSIKMDREPINHHRHHRRTIKMAART